MGCSIVQYRVAIGLFISHLVSKIAHVTYFVCPSMSDQITISFSVIALLFANVLLNGFLCFRHIVYVLCKITAIAIDVHPNPGPNDTFTVNQLKVCHCNIRSIKSDGKIDELQLLAQSENFNIVTVSETWLDEHYPDQLLLIDNFQPPFRRDRPTGRGGGLLTYIHTCLPCLRRSDLESPTCECIWVEISTQRGSVLIGNYYRPPGQTAEIRDAFIESLTNSISIAIESNPHILILTGDFNDRCVEWDSTHSDSELGMSLFNLVTQFNLFQLINEPTRTNEYSTSLLDLLITDSPGLVLDSGVLAPVSNSDHSVIFCCFSLSYHKDRAFKRGVWNFNKADFTGLNATLSSAPWDTAFDVFDSIDDVVSYWSDLFLTTAKEYIPFKEVIIRPKDKPWITTEIKKLMRQRNRAWKRFKNLSKTPRPFTLDVYAKVDRFYQYYKKRRNKVVNAVRHSIDSYFSNLQLQLDENNINPKRWWNLSKSVLGCKIHEDIPPIVEEGKIISSITEKCEVFNTYFASQCTTHADNDAPPLPNFTYRTEARMGDFTVDDTSVSKVLSSLRLTSASGPDNIGNILLKNTATSISKPLAKIFNMSLNVSHFPDSWKRSNICPVFKKSNKQIKSNYRPISLLCNVSKVFERLVYNHLYEYLLSNNLLTEKNSGFKANDSTVNQLISILHNIYNGLENSKEARMVFLDISKAFDKVWHVGLLFKLRQLGLSETMIRWIDSYLSNRFQRVIIHGQTSSWLPVQAGVPQGSILGPLLFLVYINDIVDDLTCDVRIFADDTSILEIVQNPTVSSQHLNINLSIIHYWGKLWRMIFNALKSMSVIFSAKINKPHHPPVLLGDTAIPEVDTHTHLGITLANNLSWHAHVTRITNKASQRLGLLRRFKFKLSRKSLVRLYLSMIRPILEYGCVIFDNCGQGLSDLIESIQYEAAKICTGALRHTSHAALLQELGWPTLASRRKYFKLVLFYKMFHNLTPTYLSNLVPPPAANRMLRHRSPSTIRPIKCRTKRLENSFLPDAIKQWNNLPSDIRDSLSLQIFKSKLKATLLAVDTVPNFYLYGQRSGSIYHTQLRLGFSKLHSDLYKVNIIQQPSCACSHPTENSKHFLLFCPKYAQERQKLLLSIVPLLAPGVHSSLIIHLASDRLAHILLFGSKDISDENNVLIFKAVQDFILETRRFIHS